MSSSRKVLSCVFLSMLVTSGLLGLTTVYGNDSRIVIDGNLSDWESIKPVYVDNVGDTKPWSTDTNLLSIGSTAEAPEQVPINNKVRDLKAVYVYWDTYIIYLRLDVNSLIENWGYPQKNASCFVVAFDTDLAIGSGMDDLSRACDTTTNLSACWERLLTLDSAYAAFMQDPSWAAIDGTWGNLRLAQNVTASAFELSIPHSDFPTDWNRKVLTITVASFKPGEHPTSGPNQWLHAFDPQAPGTPGEVWGDPGSSAQGSDIADVMPGGLDGIDSSGRVKSFLNVFSPPLGDANLDGKVWVEDLYLLGRAWGSRRGDARFNPSVDFDNDGRVWVYDLYVLGKNWGRKAEYSITMNVEVNCQKSLGRIRSLQGVNNGPIPWNEAHNLSTYYRDIGVNWVRLHDLHGPIGDWGSEWVGAVDVHYIFPNFEADPNQPENYNFTRTDLHIKAIKAIGANIIYRLGYSWGTIRDPPANYTQWASICLHIIRHYNDEWANGFHYNITYWEIWNEPDISEFWTGTPEQYFSLYNVTANAIKSYDPNLKVGGPCLAYKLDFLEGFLNYCRSHSVPLDFVSWHVYGQNPYEVYLRAKAVENLMETYGFSSLESVLTEWNLWTEWDEWDMVRQNPATAAFAASGLIYLQNSSTDIANYYRGDTWRWGGLFTWEGTPGKAFYSFKAFKMLLDTPNRVYCSGSNDKGYATIAGISGDGNTVTILISDMGSSRLADKYFLRVNNLPWGGGQFRYERYVIDGAHNLELVESQVCDSVNFSTTEDMKGPSVQLIRLKALGNSGEASLYNDHVSMASIVGTGAAVASVVGFVLFIGVRRKRKVV